MIFKNLFIQVLIKIGLLYWLCKCEIAYFLNHGLGFCFVIEKLPPTFIVPILRRYGASIGTDCQIDSGLIIHRIKEKSELKKLIIGNSVYIGHRMLFDLTDLITIESYCAFGANCQIWTHTGNWTFDRSDEKDIRNPVTIKTSVIIYSGCIISQNVTIGKYSRVAAGSVVTRSIDDMCFVGGVPAMFIKKRVI